MEGAVVSRARQTITGQLDPNTSGDDYAKLANAIWSLANMSDSFYGVQQDAKTNPDDLNNWYDDGRSVR